MRLDGRRVWHHCRRASALLALPLAGSALILTRPWHGHTRCPKVARHVMSYGDQVLQVTDPDDFRVAIYKGRSVRNASAYDAQIRAIAEDFLQTGSRSGCADSDRGQPKRLQPIKKMGLLVDVHYSWDCLGQLREARSAGFPVHVASVLLPLDTPNELLAIASEVASTVYVMEPELLLQGFQQDVPWTKDMATSNATTRSVWRRYEGGAAKSTCRFAVVFPPSTPLSLLDPPYVILDGLNSASNVGQVLRTAYHLGITSVVASPETWGCLNGRACRVSMGWMYRMKFHAARPLSKAILELQDLGTCVYAAENQFSEPVAPHEPLGDKMWALVVGSEGLGVSDEITQLCDRRDLSPENGLAPLLAAALNKRWAALQQLLELRAQTDAADSQGRTALILAASQGQSRAVSSLIDSRASLELRSVDGQTALLAAARHQHWMALRRLAEALADPNVVENKSAKPVILRVAETSQWDTLIHLARHRADLEVRGQGGRRVLMFAAECGLDDVAWWLLQSRANPDAQDDKGETALLKACNRQSEGLMRILWEGGANIEVAIKKSRIPAMSRLLRQWSGHEEED
eukprot:s2320_g11.t1